MSRGRSFFDRARDKVNDLKDRAGELVGRRGDGKAGDALGKITEGRFGGSLGARRRAEHNAVDSLSPSDDHQHGMDQPAT